MGSEESSSSFPHPFLSFHPRNSSAHAHNILRYVPILTVSYIAPTFYILYGIMGVHFLGGGYTFVEGRGRRKKRKEVGFLKKDFLTQTSCDIKKNIGKHWIFLRHTEKQ